MTESRRIRKAVPHKNVTTHVDDILKTSSYDAECVLRDPERRNLGIKRRVDGYTKSFVSCCLIVIWMHRVVKAISLYWCTSTPGLIPMQLQQPWHVTNLIRSDARSDQLPSQSARDPHTHLLPPNVHRRIPDERLLDTNAIVLGDRAVTYCSPPRSWIPVLRARGAVRCLWTSIRRTRLMRRS